MSDSLASRDEGPEYTNVFRATADESVWMCNIPNWDVAKGLQAARSLRRIKAYVEEIEGPGEWVRTDVDEWRFYAS